MPSCPMAPDRLPASCPLWGSQWFPGVPKGLCFNKMPTPLPGRAELRTVGYRDQLGLGEGGGCCTRGQACPAGNLSPPALLSHRRLWRQLRVGAAPAPPPLHPSASKLPPLTLLCPHWDCQPQQPAPIRAPRHPTHSDLSSPGTRGIRGAMGSLTPALAPATPPGEALVPSSRANAQCEGLEQNPEEPAHLSAWTARHKQGEGPVEKAVAGMGLGVALGLTPAPQPRPPSVLGLDSRRGC